MQSYKTIEEIRQDWDNGKYIYRSEIPNKLPETYVFDENLSIKENRRMIQEHNEKVDAMKREKMQKNADLSRQLTQDVVSYIMETYGMNETQASIVERYVYTEKHSFMCDYFSCIDSVAEMAESLLAAK